MSEGAGDALKKIGSHISGHKLAYGTIGATAAATGAYYIYRKLRKAGKDKATSARAAAQAARRAGDLDLAKKWEKTARE